jgi:IS30 family transposase
VGTLVERHSRYVILLKLPNGPGAHAVRQAMTKRILTLPAQLRRSITWDQGKDMAHHVQFSLDTGVQIYFCDPKSPWQRGSNENTNGLLRQYLPKSGDLSRCAQRELDAIARSLNTRPRHTLGWMNTLTSPRQRRCDDRLRTQPIGGTHNARAESRPRARGDRLQIASGARRPPDAAEQIDRSGAATPQ